MNCRVLWFDDQHEKLEIIRDQALIEGIDLVGVSNAEEGIFRLKRDFKLFDAVLVDGLFFRKIGHSGGNVTDIALHDVATAISELSTEKILPWFILSGQPSFTKEVNKFADVYKGNKVYDKIVPEDLVLLWTDIKKSASDSLDYQTKKFNQSAFDALDYLSIGTDAEKHILEILKSISSSYLSLPSELYFGQIRLILEQIFRSANEVGLLHDNCIKDGKVSLAESYRFLAGEPTKYFGVKCIKPHFSKIIADSVRSIIDIAGSAAHTKDSKTGKGIDVSNHLKDIGSPYLLYSITFQLLDILIWYKTYHQANSDIAANKSLWEVLPDASTPLHTGIIQQDMRGDFFCGSFLLPRSLVGYSPGDTIHILQSKDNTSFSKTTYPKFASKFEKDI